MEKIAQKFRNEEEIKKGNRIFVVHGVWEEEVKEIHGVKIIFSGQNSLIKFHEGFNIKSLTIYVGEGCYLEFGKDFHVRFQMTINAKANDTTLKIGNFANIGRAEFYMGDEPGLEVIIGDNFLQALDLYLRTADGHTIYDLNTKEILNKTKVGIHIGNHVWAGYNVTITKDAEIPDNCVIGTGAVVGKKQFEPNSIIAGVPAKTIRSGVNWDSHAICQYETLNPN